MQNSKKRDCFGHIVREDKPFKCDDHILKQYGVKVNPETGDTDIIETGEIDLTELIESYRDTCGIEYALKMIKSGMVAEDAYADDGNHSVDCTAIPNDLVSAYEAASTASGAKIANSLGITSDMTDEQITAAVFNAIKAAQAQQAAETKKEGE